jgi:hypothetical protein
MKNSPIRKKIKCILQEKNWNSIKSGYDMDFKKYDPFQIIQKSIIIFGLRFF